MPDVETIYINSDQNGAISQAVHRLLAQKNPTEKLIVTFTQGSTEKTTLTYKLLDITDGLQILAFIVHAFSPGLSAQTAFDKAHQRQWLAQIEFVIQSLKLLLGSEDEILFAQYLASINCKLRQLDTELTEQLGNYSQGLQLTMVDCLLWTLLARCLAINAGYALDLIQGIQIPGALSVHLVNCEPVIQSVENSFANAYLAKNVSQNAIIQRIRRSDTR